MKSEDIRDPAGELILVHLNSTLDGPPLQPRVSYWNNNSWEISKRDYMLIAHSWFNSNVEAPQLNYVWNGHWDAVQKCFLEHVFSSRYQKDVFSLQVHLLRTAGDEVTITVRYLREAPAFLKLPLGRFSQNHFTSNLCSWTCELRTV